MGIEQRAAAADQIHLISRELGLQISILGADHRSTPSSNADSGRISRQLDRERRGVPCIRR